MQLSTVTTKPTTVWTRWEHGNNPVEVHTDERGRKSYTHLSEGVAQFHDSARSLLRSITGRQSVPTFGKYFRITDEPEQSKPNLFGLLDQYGRDIAVDGGGPVILTRSKVVVDKPSLVAEMIDELESTLWSFYAERDQTVAKEVLDVVDEAMPGPPLGIDLEKRGHEVRRLLFAGFRGKMYSQGYDPEDVLHEVYKGLLTRNAGKCPWDARKATFGYYVHMVINCVLTNYHRKQSRRQDRHYVEIGDVHQDVRPVWPTSAGQTGEDYVSGMMAEGSLVDWLKGAGTRAEHSLAVEIMPMVKDGLQRREIVRRTGKPEAAVAKALSWLRKQTRLWAVHVGLK